MINHYRVCFEYGRKRTILGCQSRRSWKGWKQTIPTKADDLWVKADDLGRKQTIFGLKRTIFWAKADDLWVKADDPGQSRRSSRAQSRRSYLKSHSMKADDPNWRKQTILRAKTGDPMWNLNVWLQMILRDQSRRSAWMSYHESTWFVLMTHGDWLWCII